MFAESVHYERGAFSIWFRKSVPTIRVSTSGTSSNPINPNADSWNTPTKTESNASKVETTGIERVLPYENRQIAFSMNSQHSCMGLDGANKACSIFNGWSE
jgi:hypothetical protein